jgi:hypothetical protein
MSVRIERVPDRATLARCGPTPGRPARADAAADQRSAVARREAARAMIAKVEADGVVCGATCSRTSTRRTSFAQRPRSPTVAHGEGPADRRVQNPDTIARAAAGC